MKRRWLALSSLTLFLLNLWLVRRLLVIDYLDQMGSIESTYIAIARWVVRNWGDLSWFPLWYGGIPFHNTYPPLVPFTTAAVSALFSITPAHAYHAVTAVFYSLGPVTLCLLAWRLCRSAGWSFAVGLLYSLTSASTFLIPAVRQDAGGVWSLRRLQVLIRYGEGPHITALALLPMAVLLLSVAYEKKRLWWWAAAGIALASVALTNWLGAAALAMAVAAWLLAREDGVWWRAWLRAAGVALFAYILALPGIPPSAIFTIAANERNVSGPLTASWLRFVVVACGVLLVAAACWAFRRFRTPEHLRFSLLFLLPTAAVVLLNAWFGVTLAPQPNRYHLELEMALALAVVFLLREALGGVRRRAALIAVLLACVYPAVKAARYADRLIHPVEIASTVEYQEAQWFDKNMRGGRVLAPGSVGFFLNVFTDTPQFAGGFDQGVVNPVYAGVHYQLLSGENAGEREGEVALVWLRAFGVDAVAVSGPRGRDYYKAFRNPHKFNGLLPELRRDGDDVIYRVPRRSASLAHVVRVTDLPARAPIHGLDIDPVRAYVAALENPAYPEARFEWRDNHSAVIFADMEKDQVLSIQVSYHPGWKATVNGQSRRVFADKLGQMVIEPQCQGPCKVEVRYE
jgi:hypothetical protein